MLYTYYEYFENYLLDNSHGFNPLNLFSKTTTNNYEYPKSNNKREENEIRCHICLKLVWNPVHPGSFFQYFAKLVY
jgi:hypothetical protein